MNYNDEFTIEDADDLPEIGPRSPDEILTAPPMDAPDDSLFSDVSALELPPRSLEDSKEVLETSMVRALLRIMNSSTAREADIIKAVGEAGELIGKKGKGSVNIVRAENAQINQIMEKPELMDHIKKAADGIKKVASASNAGIKVHSGGKGD